MIKWLIEVYIILTLVDAVMSFIPNPDIRRHPFVQMLRKIADVPQKPIRELMPPNVPFDLSPLIVILVLRMLATLF